MAEFPGVLAGVGPFRTFRQEPTGLPYVEGPMFRGQGPGFTLRSPNLIQVPAALIQQQAAVRGREPDGGASVASARLAAGGLIGTTILVAAEVPNFYSGLLPSMFTISSDFFHGQGSVKGNTKRIRQGEAMATALSLSVGFGASLLVNNWLPLMATGVMCLALLGCYEYALRHPAAEEG